MRLRAVSCHTRLQLSRLETVERRADALQMLEDNVLIDAKGTLAHSYLCNILYRNH